MSEFVNDIFSQREEERKQETRKYWNLLNESKKEIDLADHLFFITYPSVKDLKMLMAIEDHIVRSVFNSLHSLLEYLRQIREIEAYPTVKSMMIDIFGRRVVNNKTFVIMDKQFLLRLYEIEHYLKNSNLQFKRGESYILALPDQSIKSLNVDIVRHHLTFAKDFASKVEKELNTERDNTSLSVR